MSSQVEAGMAVTETHRALKMAFLASSLLLLIPIAAMAQDIPDADTREVQAYTLTEAGLARYAQASENLSQLDLALSNGCDDEYEDVTSLDGMVARIRQTPDAAAAIESAGMPVREYAVFTGSMMQNGLAAWALDQGAGLPAGVSAENVAFFRAHQDEIQQLPNLAQAGDCNSGEGDEYEEYDEDYDDG